MAWRGRERLSNPALGLDGGPRGEGEVGGSYSLDNCRAAEELVPNRHQIISVLLYIPYSFTGTIFKSTEGGGVYLRR